MIRATASLSMVLTASTLTLLLAGCGGGGGASSPVATTVPANSYRLDPAFTPTIQYAPAGETGVIPSGVSSKGDWMEIATYSKVGYYIAGSYRDFPTAKVTGSSVQVVAAGGHYVWAIYFKSGFQTGLATLNVDTGKIVQTDKVSNPAVSPDGSSAFVEVTDTNGNPTSRFAVLTATGVLTNSAYEPPTPSTFFYPAVRSNAGWTVGQEQDFTSDAKKAHAASVQGAQLVLVSPTGSRTVLQGNSPFALSVNDNGVAAGSDVPYACYWTPNGKQTLLQPYSTGATEQVNCILNNGFMVGTSQSEFSVNTALLWKPDGSAVNLTSRVLLSGKESFTQALQLQPNGKLLGFGADAQGNPAFLSLVAK